LEGILVAKNATGGGWVNFVFDVLAPLDEIFHPPPSSENTPVSKLSFKRFFNE